MSGASDHEERGTTKSNLFTNPWRALCRLFPWLTAVVSSHSKWKHTESKLSQEKVICLCLLCQKRLPVRSSSVS